MTNLRNDVWLYGLAAALRYRLVSMVRSLLPVSMWQALAMWALYGRKGA